MPKLLDPETAVLSKMEVGDWYFTKDDAYICIRVTEKDEGFVVLPLKQDPDLPSKPIWQWDGNKEAPTITPSILLHINPQWHGFMTNGKLVLA